MSESREAGARQAVGAILTGAQRADGTCTDSVGQLAVAMTTAASLLGLLVVETAALADAKIAEFERRAAYDERLATSMEKALVEPKSPKPCPGCGHAPHRGPMSCAGSVGGDRCFCMTVSPLTVVP